MSEKVKTFTPNELVDWFRENNEMRLTMPWAANLIAHKDSIGRGCKCKAKAKKNNFETVYKNMVLEIFVQNPHPVAIMKRELEVDKIIFQLGEETLKEF
mgnify:FL=1|jgi:hypothetical protein|tara:strand:- start:1866 stop:2162 length:297 start_codon:yes stop_codon:yes gene_type:complete